MPTKPIARTAEPPLEPVPPAVPLKYAGKWLAWSADGQRIIAVGDTMEEALAAGRAAGEPEPALMGVPRGRR